MSKSLFGRSAAARIPTGRIWSICLLGTVAFGIGCGGGKPAKPARPPGSIVVQPPGAAPAPAVAQAPVAAAPQFPTSTEVEEAEAPGPDDFEILEEYEEPKWEIVGEVSDLTTVEVTEQPPEMDSTSFLAIPPRLAIVNIAPRTDILPSGFAPVPGCDITSEGIPLRISGGKSGAVMAYIQAGVFVRGNNDGPNETRPQQSVFLDGFYMDVTEVTLEQYEKFRAEMTEQKKPSRAPANADGSPSEPALGLNWQEALIFARWAGKELPTEAQWEKAARGPTGFSYPWGNGRALWQRTRSPSQIDPVGSFRGDTSPFGIMDLAGNAREWCADKFSDTAYEAEHAGGEATLRNPKGPNVPSITDHRVIRGDSPDWIVWHRSGELASKRLPDVGCRCVLNLNHGSATKTAQDEEKPSKPEKPARSGKSKGAGKAR